MADKVFSVDFDPDKFVSGIEKSLQELDKFEQGTAEFNAAMKKLQETVNGVSFTKPIADLNQLKSILQQSNFKLNFDGVNRTIDEFIKDIPAMKKLLDELKAKLNTTTDGKEFNDLRAAIKQVETGLEQLGAETTETDQKFVSLRQRIREGTIALQELEDAGLENTQRYRELQNEVAELTDRFGDQRARIRALASDTFAINASVQAVQGVTAAFQVWEGVTAALGVENEDLQETLVRLNAVMNIANGIQTVSNLIKEEGALRTAVLAAKDLIAAAAQRVFAASATQAAVAQTALNTAVSATPWGAILAIIGAVVGAIYALSSATDDATNANERFNQSLDDIRENLRKTNVQIDNETKVAIARAKAEGKSVQDIFEIETTGLAKGLAALVKAESDAIKEREKLLKGFGVGSEIDVPYTEAGVYLIRRRIKTIQDLNAEEKEAYEKANKDLETITEQKNTRQAELDARYYTKQAETAEKQSQKTVKTSKKTNDDLLNLEREYQKKLADLKNKTLNLQESQQPKTEQSIKDRIDRELNAEIDANNEKFKKLGPEKLKLLNDSTTAYYNLQKDIEVKGFKDAQKAAQAELLKSLADQQDALTNERIALIQNEYERVNAEIAQGEKERSKKINDEFDSRKKDIEAKLKEGVIDQAEADRQIAEAEAIKQERLTLIAQDGNNKRLANNKKTLEDLVQQAEINSDLEVSIQNKKNAELILAEANRYKSGEISYREFQKRVKKINEDAAADEKKLEEKRIQDRIDGLKKVLAVEIDPVKIKEIATEINNLQAELSKLLTAGITDRDKDKLKEDVDIINSILGSIFNLDANDERVNTLRDQVNSAISDTISLLNEQAAAELRAADAAVQAQEKRVNEALKIAEAGNAEYLKQEEDALRDLENKREAAARRQLEIDAALRASSILLALAEGVKKGVTSAQTPGGAAIGIATIIATIAAALAGGSALASSLQTVRLAEGTDAVGRENMTGGSDRLNRGRYRSGKDTIPAWLDEGEAVISRRETDLYQPTIRAIRRGLVPHNVMNGFVNGYKNGINYVMIGNAAKSAQASSVTDMAETNNRLKRLEGVLGNIESALGGMKYNITMDADGFAASIQQQINKRNKIITA